MRLNKEIFEKFVYSSLNNKNIEDDNINSPNYLIEISNIFGSLLSENHSSHYQYNTITFRNESNLFVSPINYNNNFENKNNVEKLSKILSDLRNNGKAINLTEIIEIKLKKTVILYNSRHKLLKKVHDVEYVDLRPLVKILKSNNYSDVDELIGNTKVIESIKKIIIRKNYKVLFFNDDGNNELTNFLIIYSLLSLDSNIFHYFLYPKLSHEYFSGLFLLTIKKHISEDDFYFIKIFFSFILSEFLIERAKKEEKNKIFMAQKASISKILNRNYSHHIGSHVSNRAKFVNILERIGIEVDKLQESFSKVKTVINMMHRLDVYKDERNEFIANINNTFNLQPAKFYFDVILPFLENSLIIDNISASEGIRYKNDLINCKLKIKVYYKRNEIFGKIISKNKEIYQSNNLGYFKEVASIEDDRYYDEFKYADNSEEVIMGLPGPLGKHAVYSILENIIRNTSKHNTIPEQKDLEILIYLEDDIEDNRFYNIEITDNISSFTNKFNEINKYLKSNEVYDDKWFGFTDMKINAALLKGLDDSNIFEEESLELLDKNGRLCYKFKLKKYNFAVFYNKEFEIKEGKNDFIIKYNKFLNPGLCDFVIIHENMFSGLDFNEISSILGKFTMRVIIFVENDKKYEVFNNYVKTNKNLFESSNILLDCWNIWLKELFNQNNYSIFVNFDDNQLSDRWKNKYHEEESKSNLCVKLGVFKDNIKIENLDIDNNSIIYDRHFDMLKKVKDKKKDTISFLNSGFCGRIEKNSSDFNNIINRDVNNNFISTIYSMVEAGLLKVLIIDERIADRLKDRLDHYNYLKYLGFEKNELSEITRFDACLSSNIFIVSDLLIDNKNLDILKNNKENDTRFQINIDTDKEIISYSSNSKFTNGSFKIPDKMDILIIHRTILDSILTYYSGFLKLSNKNFKRIIIDTGGGQLKEKYKNYKILPYRILEYDIGGNNIAKYSLTQKLIYL